LVIGKVFLENQMCFDLSLRISYFHSLYVCYISYVLITFVFLRSCFVDLLSSFLHAIFFFYSLSCMLACNSFAVVYMLFVLGMFSKILFVQMYTNKFLGTSFFLCWACVLLKAPKHNLSLTLLKGEFISS